MQKKISNRFTQMFSSTYSASLSKTDIALEFIALLMHLKYKVWLAWKIMQPCLEFWYFHVLLQKHAQCSHSRPSSQIFCENFFSNVLFLTFNVSDQQVWQSFQFLEMISFKRSQSLLFCIQLMCKSLDVSFGQARLWK